LRHVFVSCGKQGKYIKEIINDDFIRNIKRRLKKDAMRAKDKLETTKNIENGTRCPSKQRECG